MKPPNKAIITLISIPILILLFFSSNIYGYFRFKSYCSSDGGLRVYEKLERNMGWWAKDKYEAQVAAQLIGVGFVRYKDKKDGNTYDIRFIGKDPQRDSSYEKLMADDSKKLAYKWRYVNENLPNEIRLGKHGYEVLDIHNDKILVRFYMFGYSQLEPSNTFLAAPSGVGCFDEVGRVDEPSRWHKELNTVFIN